MRTADPESRCFQRPPKLPSEGCPTGAQSDLNLATEQAILAMECYNLRTTLRWLRQYVAWHYHAYAGIQGHIT